MKTVALGITLCCSLWAQETPPPRYQANPGASVVLVKGLHEGAFRQGSGVVVAPGIVATNAHVVSGAGTVAVIKGSDQWIVREFCVEPERDLCLLTVPGLTMTPAVVGKPEEAMNGRSVRSIGYPDGVLQSRPGQLVATWSYQGSQLLQSNAPIAPGSSGGGLFTEDGKLLGITTFIYGGNGRLNFSIPIDWIGRLRGDGVLRAKLSCPGLARENITQTFFEHITEDPANLDSWDALSRFWVQDSPEDPNAWFARGLALRLLEDRYLERSGGEVDTRLLEDSITAYRRAVQFGPNSAKAWNNLGVALDHLSRFGEARRAFERAIELQPQEPLAWLNLGSTLINNQQYKLALVPFKKGLALQGDNALGWSRLAYCQGALGSWGEAIRSYQIALRWCPFRAAWWGDLYQACLRVRDAEGAAAALVKLRELEPDLARRMEELEKPVKQGH